MRGNKTNTFLHVGFKSYRTKAKSKKASARKNFVEIAMKSCVVHETTRMR